MAVDVCYEVSSPVVSPRISFSHDLNNQSEETDKHHPRSDALLLLQSSTIDFDFCAISTVQQLSSADELFSNGKILPTQIKKPEQMPKPLPENLNDDPKKKRLKDILLHTEEEDEEGEKPSMKSFWQFRRSASLNCDNGRGKSLLRSLQILSRSNSTGSAPNPKQTIPSLKKQNSKKQPPLFTTRSNSYSNAYYSYNNSSQRPPLKKNCRAYGNGVRISPVLNIPPSYISKGTISLFGIGSLFCNGKAKKKKK